MASSSNRKPSISHLATTSSVKKQQQKSTDDDDDNDYYLRNVTMPNRVTTIKGPARTAGAAATLPSLSIQKQHLETAAVVDSSSCISLSPSTIPKRPSLTPSTKKSYLNDTTKQDIESEKFAQRYSYMMYKLKDMKTTEVSAPSPSTKDLSHNKSSEEKRVASPKNAKSSTSSYNKMTRFKVNSDDYPDQDSDDNDKFTSRLQHKPQTNSKLVSTPLSLISKNKTSNESDDDDDHDDNHDGQDEQSDNDTFKKKDKASLSSAISAGAAAAGGSGVLRAPNELLQEFLVYVMKKQWMDAHKLCRFILMYEPHNKSAKEFLPLIEAKLENKSSSSSSSDDDSSDDGSSSSSSDKSNDKKKGKEASKKTPKPPGDSKAKATTSSSTTSSSSSSSSGTDSASSSDQEQKKELKQKQIQQGLQTYIVHQKLRRISSEAGKLIEEMIQKEKKGEKEDNSGATKKSTDAAILTKTSPSKARVTSVASAATVTAVQEEKDDDDDVQIPGINKYNSRKSPSSNATSSSKQHHHHHYQHQHDHTRNEQEQQEQYRHSSAKSSSSEGRNKQQEVPPSSHSKRHYK